MCTCLGSGLVTSPALAQTGPCVTTVVLSMTPMEAAFLVKSYGWTHSKGNKFSFFSVKCVFGGVLSRPWAKVLQCSRKWFLPSYHLTWFLMWEAGCLFPKSNLYATIFHLFEKSETRIWDSSNGTNLITKCVPCDSCRMLCDDWYWHRLARMMMVMRETEWSVVWVLLPRLESLKSFREAH